MRWTFHDEHLLPTGLDNVDDNVSHLKSINDTTFNLLVGGTLLKPTSKSRIPIPLSLLISSFVEIDVQWLKEDVILHRL
jgi:hypothetical protein